MTTPNIPPSTTIPVPDDALQEVLRCLPLASVLELRYVNSFFHEHYIRLREELVKKLVGSILEDTGQRHSRPRLRDRYMIAYELYYCVSGE